MNTKLLQRLAIPILVIAIILFFIAMNSKHSTGSSNSLQGLYTQINNGDIKKVEIYPDNHRVTVTPRNSDESQYTIGATDDDIQTIESKLNDNDLGSAYEVVPTKSSGIIGYLLQIVVPFGLLLVFWIFLMNQMQGGGSKVLSFGKSKAKRMAVDAPKVTFKDVAGVDEAVEELQEIKEFLENPRKFQALGARIPKGVLLFGPPGTGKTLLARAVAGEAGVPFFSISGSDFVEMFVGVGASRVRDLFEQAKLHNPCIIFVDEIDAVGRHRGAGMGGGNDEREQTLNQLLVEMDGFEMKDNVIIIAATNRPDILDPALLRPGRFDRQVKVDAPDRPGREAILAVHSKGKPLGKDLDLRKIAAQTPGFTGADLANLVNEGALLAARRGLKRVGMAEFEEGIMRVIAGPEKKARLMTESERRVTAVHEMGHALCAHFIEDADPVHKISIVGRGMALGYVVSLPTEDRFMTKRAELMARLAQALGGRTAEELVFDDITTGAESDFKTVTQIAKRMVMQWGMSDKLGPRTFGNESAQPFLGRDFQAEPDYSDELAREIDEEIKRLIDEAHALARTTLADHREDLERLATILIEHETIDSDQFDRLLKGEQPDDVFPDLPPPPAAESLSEDQPSGEDQPQRRPPSVRPMPGFGTEA